MLYHEMVEPHFTETVQTGYADGGDAAEVSLERLSLPHRSRGLRVARRSWLIGEGQTSVLLSIQKRAVHSRTAHHRSRPSPLTHHATSGTVLSSLV